MKLEPLSKTITAVRTDETVIRSAQDALDLIASARYGTECQALILPKEALAEDFFRLPTGLAGDVLQKFVNYQTRLAVVGDFSRYTSKNLLDFLGESNRGKSVCFVPTEAEALAWLSK